MFDDYGEIKAHESLKGTNVDNPSRDKYDGLIIEHIFKNVCIVRWNSLMIKSKQTRTVEFIKDLKIK